MLCFRAALLFPVALARRAWFNQSGREIGVAEARMDQLVVDPDTDAQPPEKLDAESAQPVKGKVEQIREALQGCVRAGSGN